MRGVFRDFTLEESERRGFNSNRLKKTSRVGVINRIGSGEGRKNSLTKLVGVRPEIKIGKKSLENPRRGRNSDVYAPALGG